MFDLYRRSRQIENATTLKAYESESILSSCCLARVFHAASVFVCSLKNDRASEMGRSSESCQSLEPFWPAQQGSTQLDLDQWEELEKECGSVFASMYGRFQRYPHDTSPGTFAQPSDKIPTRTLGLLLAACCCFCLLLCCCWLAAVYVPLFVR